MLYIIIGPAKSGKTLLRRYILENKKISGISTDWLRAMIDPYMYQKSLKESRKIMDGFLLNFTQEIIKYSDEDYLIEGDMFNIKLIDKLIENNNIKVLILAYPNIISENKIKEMKKNIQFKDSWIYSCSDKNLKDKIIKGIDESKKLEKYSSNKKVIFQNVSEKINLKKIMEVLFK